MIILTILLSRHSSRCFCHRPAAVVEVAVAAVVRILHSMQVAAAEVETQVAEVEVDSQAAAAAAADTRVAVVEVDTPVVAADTRAVDKLILRKNRQ